MVLPYTLINTLVFVFALIRKEKLVNTLHKPSTERYQHVKIETETKENGVSFACALNLLVAPLDPTPNSTSLLVVANP